MRAHKSAGGWSCATVLEVACAAVMGCKAPVARDDALEVGKPVVGSMEDEEDVVVVLAHPVSQSRPEMHRI